MPNPQLRSDQVPCPAKAQPPHDMWSMAGSSASSFSSAVTHSVTYIWATPTTSSATYPHSYVLLVGQRWRDSVCLRAITQLASTSTLVHLWHPSPHWATAGLVSYPNLITFPRPVAHELQRGMKQLDAVSTQRVWVYPQQGLVFNVIYLTQLKIKSVIE